MTASSSAAAPGQSVQRLAASTTESTPSQGRRIGARSAALPSSARALPRFTSDSTETYEGIGLPGVRAGGGDSFASAGASSFTSAERAVAARGTMSSAAPTRSTALGGSASSAPAAQRIATSPADAASSTSARVAARQPGRGALRALPRSAAPVTASGDALQRAPVRPVAVARPAEASEPGGSVGGGMDRNDIASMIERALANDGNGGGASSPAAARAQRGDSVTSLPIGGMAGTVAAARSAARDAVQRAIDDSGISDGGSSGGGGGFGGGSRGGGGSHRRSSAQMPSRAITTHVGGGGSTGGGFESAPVQRQVSEAEMAAPAPTNQADAGAQRTPAQQQEQLADLLDVLQARILAELERRGGRYRGMF